MILRSVSLFHVLIILSIFDVRLSYINLTWLNPLMGTLKPQSNGPLYSSTVIGTLAVDGRPVPSSLYQT